MSELICWFKLEEPVQDCLLLMCEKVSLREHKGQLGPSVAPFCVATECRAFLSSGATTYRRGAGDLFEVSGDNVNLLLPGSEPPVPPNWRARRPAEPAARAPPRNNNNVDIG